MTRLGAQAWISAAETRAVVAALGEVRFVGGAVRNALIGQAVSDIDLATPLLPDEVQRRLAAAGIASVPTGIEHGTITAISGGKPFEVTTLRRDVSTDGRRAVVAFTQDWAEDARRRDFTMNALYAGSDGEVFDYVGGIEDLKAGRVRFVGDPGTRIREDYLRILRLFRFHAWYGKGELDPAALSAAETEKAGLAKLSGERIAKEMLRLLEAENPLPALRAMAATGILSEIVPGVAELARLKRLVEIDSANFFRPDAGLRLAALLPRGAAGRVADRWKLPNELRARLDDLDSANEKVVSYLSMREVRRLLYRLGPRRFRDRVFLHWALDARNAAAWRALVAMADTWQRPRFPLSGRDVMMAGVAEGPLVGRVLAEVEEWWIDSDFADDEFSLTERLKAVAQAHR